MKPIEIQYQSLTEKWFDEVMYTVPAAKSWSPKHALDIFRPWPEKYINVHHQPFNPFVFAVNCSALLGAARQTGLSKAIQDQMKYLELLASFYTERIGGADYIRNDFDFPIFWAVMPKPFYGAFMNCYTALGYMKLFEIDKQESYLQKAHGLLTTSTSQSAEIKLCGPDSQGDFWLNEYVFRAAPHEVSYLQAIGSESGDDGFMRFRIFNGHIHALIALMRYKHLTNHGDFDKSIDAAMQTMAKKLNQQLIDDRYFSYAVEANALPDYGQARAVHLAKALANCTDSDELTMTYQHFSDIYTTNIKPAEERVYSEGRDKARNYYMPIQRKLAANAAARNPLLT